MSTEENETFINTIRYLLKALDLRNFFPQRRILKVISGKNVSVWKDPAHRKLLMQLISVCGDYAFHIKPFHIVERFTKALYGKKNLLIFFLFKFCKNCIYDLFDLFCRRIL